MSLFSKTETTPLQEFLATTSSNSSCSTMSSETWKTAAKVAAAGIIICGTVYAVRRFQRGNRRKSSRNGRPPPPLIGVSPAGEKSGITQSDLIPAEGIRVKNDTTTVKHLMVFPVKSCRGIEVESFFVGQLGPEIHTPHGAVRDRSWMVVTEKMSFLSQRRKPRMALIQPAIEGEFLFLSAPDMPPLRVPLNPDVRTSKIVTSEVWDQAVEAIDCGDEAGKWFADFLELPALRLVYHPPSFAGRNRAAADSKFTDKKLWEDKDACAFADDAPFNLLNLDSVNELNRHLSQPAPWVHFRPNIVVAGCPPHSEDYWGRFRIGSAAQFRNGKLNPRCIETAVDPQTGTFTRKDILETLKKIRANQSPEWDDLYKAGPLMAIFLAADNFGQISVGDPIIHID